MQKKHGRSRQQNDYFAVPIIGNKFEVKAK